MGISLKIVKEEDWDFVLDLRNEKNFRKYFQNQKHIEKNEHYEYLNKQKNNPNFFNWIICDNSDDVGYVRILDNDVSIMIKPSHHGKGIGTMVLSHLLKYGFKKLHLHRISAEVIEYNENSIHLFEKSKFKTDAIFREVIWRNNQWWNIKSMSILKEDFK